MLNFILEYWIEILFGLIVSFLGYFFKQILNYKHKLDDTNKGIVVMLKFKIIEKYDEFIKKESITIEEKEGLMDLYNVYIKFECCDVVSDLIKKIDSIPIK